jgi:hypothetical protein
VLRASQVLVGANDQTSAIDARGDAQLGSRHAQDLIDAGRQCERGDRRRTRAGVEVERAHSNRPIGVEYQRLRRARIVNGRERVYVCRRRSACGGGFGRPHGLSISGRGLQIEDASQEDEAVSLRRLRLCFHEKAPSDPVLRRVAPHVDIGFYNALLRCLEHGFWTNPVAPPGWGPQMFRPSWIWLRAEQHEAGRMIN